LAAVAVEAAADLVAEHQVKLMHILAAAEQQVQQQLIHFLDMLEQLEELQEQADQAAQMQLLVPQDLATLDQLGLLVQAEAAAAEAADLVKLQVYLVLAEQVEMLL
jgi:hypothetical protein